MVNSPLTATPSYTAARGELERFRRVAQARDGVKHFAFGFRIRAALGSKRT